MFLGYCDYLVSKTQHKQVSPKVFYEPWNQLYYDLGRKLEVISTSSDIASQVNNTQRKDGKRSNTWNRIQLFARVSQKTNK